MPIPLSSHNTGNNHEDNNENTMITLIILMLNTYPYHSGDTGIDSYKNCINL